LLGNENKFLFLPVWQAGLPVRQAGLPVRQAGLSLAA
jgi:hypothetical protein